MSSKFKQWCKFYFANHTFIIRVLIICQDASASCLAVREYYLSNIVNVKDGLHVVTQLHIKGKRFWM